MKKKHKAKLSKWDKKPKIYKILPKKLKYNST